MSDWGTLVKGKTAIIVCDVWDAHHCLNAVRRLDEMVPTMNCVLEKARDQGAMIVHAPSSCMEAYKDHPARKRAQSAPAARTSSAKGANRKCIMILSISFTRPT